MDAKHPIDINYVLIVLSMPIEVFFLDLKVVRRPLKDLDDFVQAFQALVVQVGHVLDLANGSKKAFSSSDF